MEYIIFGIVTAFIWIGFEMWRAPMMEENEAGKLIEKSPQKKLSDLFKKNNKSK